MAHKATQRLIQEGEEVSRLILIDSPPPKGLDRLPQAFYDVCFSVNLFEQAPMSVQSGQAAPAELLAHFKANIEVLHDFHADPLPEGFTPGTTIVWASEYVFDGQRYPKLPSGPDDTEGMKFLNEKRTDFSAATWEIFFPGDTIRVEAAEGATHFSLMVQNPFSPRCPPLTYSWTGRKGASASALHPASHDVVRLRVSIHKKVQRISTGLHNKIPHLAYCRCFSRYT